MSTLTINSPALFERLWIFLATNSLPVPFSPVMRTFASVTATFLTVFITLIIVGEAPKMIFSPPVLIAFFSLRLSFFRIVVSSLDSLSFQARLMVARSLESSQGLRIKSTAPSFIAFTASSTSPDAVTITTLMLLSRLNISLIQKSPSLPL